MRVTRHNIDELLDAGLLEIAMGPGKWQPVQRRGRSFWGREPNSIRIPIKYGHGGRADIYGHDFLRNGWLNFNIRVSPRAKGLGLELADEVPSSKQA